MFINRKNAFYTFAEKPKVINKLTFYLLKNNEDIFWDLLFKYHLWYIIDR